MLESLILGAYRLKIEPDESPESPRDWDNLGNMVCWHNRYNLGDVQPKISAGDYLDEMAAEVDDAYSNAPDNRRTKERRDRVLNKHYIKLPLYLYDHSGITINTAPYSCRWDSGVVGFIYVSVARVKEEYGWKTMTRKRREHVENMLRAEVKVYDQYLIGDVWGYILDKLTDGDDDDFEEIESVWGHYGDDYCWCEGIPALLHAFGLFALADLFPDIPEQKQAQNGSDYLPRVRAIAARAEAEGLLTISEVSQLGLVLQVLADCIKETTECQKS